MDNNSVNQIRDLTIQGIANDQSNGLFVVVPEGFDLRSSEEFNDFPNRKKGTLSFFDEDSFVAAVDQEKTLETWVFGTISPAKFTAIFNYHGEAPGWGDYKAEYACPHSEEWKIWAGHSFVRMSQKEFAEFIGSNLPDINFGDGKYPSGAQMLEVACTFSAKSNVKFSSGVRLANGNIDFRFEEKTEAKARGGFLVPELFNIAIPVFENGELYAIEARFRYRIESGKLSVWYELVRSHKVLQHAVKILWQSIETKINRKIFMGKVGV